MDGIAQRLSVMVFARRVERDHLAN